MAEIHQKNLTAITAQASAAITANTYSGGTNTVVDQGGAAGNAKGAFVADCYANVTTATIWWKLQFGALDGGQ